MRLNRTRIAGMTTAGMLALAPFTLAACGEETTGAEQGASVQDIQEEDTGTLAYEGAYDSAFYGDIDSYVGEQVTVSAEVNEVLDQQAMTIAGTDGEVEPLLVVGAGDTSAYQNGEAVQVTGTVEQNFVLTDVEDELGVDLTDDLYADFEGEPYVMASSVDSSVPNTEE
ncbi:hypothetical protein ACI8AC_05820 [Geodermatophilus sp. SYSU D00758]